METIRFTPLYNQIRQSKSRSLMEIGVCHGINALNMIKAAQENFPEHPEKVHYIGFDLFEDGPKPKEGEDINIYAHPAAQEVVQAKLEATGASITLIKGTSLLTVPEYIKMNKTVFDLIFIDGGHDFTHVLSDWLNIECLIQKHTIVMFDDYYTNGYVKNQGTEGVTAVLALIDTQKYDVGVCTKYSDRCELPYPDHRCHVRVKRNN